jgi:regulator of PEP synthase PpsR (kinase-PPPase family)
MRRQTTRQARDAWVKDTDMAVEIRTLFILSDGTGITLEQLVRTLFSQYDDLQLNRVVRPFLDSVDKIDAVVAEVNRAAAQDPHRPVVFSSVVDVTLRARLRETEAEIFDVYDMYLAPLSQALGLPHTEHVGISHGIGDVGQYDRRIEAVNFALNYDDGSRFKGLDAADLILIGVSRSGKTPTCLYLAMQYAVRAANFPLTEDDFLNGAMPKPLQTHAGHLFGLTIAPERLHRIREERRPGSEYASLAQCRSEVSAAEGLFRSYGIPYLDSTAVSIEELAIEIMQRVGVERAY